MEIKGRALLDEKKEKYKELLSKESIDAIDRFFEILKIQRQKVIQNPNEISFLKDAFENENDDVKRIFELMENYKKDIKDIFIDQKMNIFHITDRAPEDMLGGCIRRSINRDNNYFTERVNGTFASSDPIDGTNAYMARNPKHGMISIYSKAIVYGGDHMIVEPDENGKNKVKLKEPNYVYIINPEKFMPVVTLNRDIDDKAYFEFSEEWISDYDVNIADKNQVLGIEKITDITSIIENFQVLCDINQSGDARLIRNLPPYEQLNAVLERVNDGRFRYINQEAGINLLPEVTNIINSKLFYSVNKENDIRDEMVNGCINCVKKLKKEQQLENNEKGLDDNDK